VSRPPQAPSEQTPAHPSRLWTNPGIAFRPDALPARPTLPHPRMPRAPTLPNRRTRTQTLGRQQRPTPCPGSHPHLPGRGHPTHPDPPTPPRNLPRVRRRRIRPSRPRHRPRRRWHRHRCQPPTHPLRPLPPRQDRGRATPRSGSTPLGVTGRPRPGVPPRPTPRRCALARRPVTVPDPGVGVASSPCRAATVPLTGPRLGTCRHELEPPGTGTPMSSSRRRRRGRATGSCA
jgi:hypothetical protein